MIAILKYNAGNIKSVQNALTRLGYESIITDNPVKLLNADKVIFPGVGEASSAMQYLKERGLNNTILSLKQPVLGICLGLQLMCRYSEEGDTECLGIFDSNVRLFPPTDKIPHIGWNNFLSMKGDLFKGIELEDDLYYVHSYYAEISSCTSATCDYILPFSASMQSENFYATQFHPEKSAGVGEKILQNFLNL
jgi:imidazole glycerol-phosphate synthase subunit HisH